MTDQEVQEKAEIIIEEERKKRAGQGEANKNTGGVFDAPLDLPALINVEPEPIKWFIKDRLILGRGLVVCGIGGSGKTRLIKQLSVGAGLGRLPWGWEVCKQGHAVLVLTEDTADEFHRNIHYIVKSLNLSPEEIKRVYSNIVVYPLAGEDVILLEKKGKGTIETSLLFEKLVTKIRDLGDVVFVGLDPALSLTDGDEMDQGHQRRLGKMCDNLGVLTGATVCLVAHAPKTIKKEISSHNSRGGGALTDAVRTELVMRTMTEEEAKAAGVTPEERFRHVQLVATKGNFLPPAAFLPVWLRRDDYGNLSGADLDFNSKDKDTPCENDMQAYEVLAELSRDGAEPQLAEWRTELVKQKIIVAKTPDAEKQAMERIKNRLKKANLIRSPKYGRWIPEDRSPKERKFDFNE